MRYTLLAMLAIATMNVGAAGGDAKLGEAKSGACVACHGPQGNSVNPIWPKLAGQHAAYFVKQLKAFKSGARKDPLMAPQAMILSEDDMNNLAAYFAAQKAK
jgi:cytochrome c553